MAHRTRNEIERARQALTPEQFSEWCYARVTAELAENADKAARRLLIDRAAESALAAARDVLNPDAGRYKFLVDQDGKAAERPARPKDAFKFIVNDDGTPAERDEK